MELFEAAKKAADAAAIDGVSSSGPEVSRCIDALKQLKTFPITYDILVSTQVTRNLLIFFCVLSYITIGILIRDSVDNFLEKTGYFLSINSVNFNGLASYSD